ncbi:MAG: VpsF family polysaccharide biosynthesis protein [Hyphomicrobiaceae bacterium]|nr:VpsF family polysaccharide biosynthesis protein [Hyphomicrobiaceae bacterium]
MQSETTNGGGLLVSVGRFAIIALYFTISADVLIINGWQYDSPGGTPFDKLHPATLVAFALLPIMAAERGNPLTGLISLANRHIRLLPFFLGIVFMIGYVTLVTKAPFTIFAETFLGPLVLLLMFEKLGQREGKWLARLLHVLIVANALLGIYELVFSYHLTPYLVQGEPMLSDWRSTALLGHPLANASIVGSYVVVLALGGHKDLPGPLALLFGSISFASLFAFGGRAATALVIAGLLLIAFSRMVSIMRGQSFSLPNVIAVLVAAPLGALAIYTIWEQGFFDLFIVRISDDSGSASTRLELFTLFNHLNWSDLLFLPDHAQIATWVNILGLEYGIENFVASFILSYGIVASIVFLSALLHFCWQVALMLRPNTGWAFVYFFGVALTSVSLSAKSPLFSLFIVLISVLMRVETVGAPHRQGGDGVHAGNNRMRRRLILADSP